MPRFVPVSNPELAKNEQNLYSEDNIKHRKFDTPDALVKPKVDRGWQQGSMGWGVLGAFGSDEKDDGLHISRRSDAPSKMVKNEQGLWVKAKESSTSTNNSVGKGRGSGIPCYNPSQYTSESSTVDNTTSSKNTMNRDEFDYIPPSKQRSITSDQFKDNTKEDKYRYSGDKYDIDRNRDRNNVYESISSSSDRRNTYHSRRNQRSRSRSRSRSHSRSDSRDRNRGRYKDDKYHNSRDRQYDHRYATKSSSSSDNHRRYDTSREHHSQNRYDKYKENDRYDRYDKDDRRVNEEKKYTSSRSSERCNDGYKESREIRDQSSSKDNKSHYGTREHEESAEDEEGESEEDEEHNDNNTFHFTAIQIVNRLLEVYSDDKSSAFQRLDNIMELYDIHAMISSLKTNKVLLNGCEAIRQSFVKTVPLNGIDCTRRIYIPSVPPNKDSTICTLTTHLTSSSSSSALSSSTEGLGTVDKYTYSYCIDFHQAGTTPGLGDPSKDTVLLYQCNESAVKIVHVWGAVDPDHIASQDTIQEKDIYTSTVWNWILKILSINDIDFNETTVYHYHDYTNIETI